MLFCSQTDPSKEDLNVSQVISLCSVSRQLWFKDSSDQHLLSLLKWKWLEKEKNCSKWFGLLVIQVSNKTNTSVLQIKQKASVIACRLIIVQQALFLKPDSIYIFQTRMREDNSRNHDFPLEDKKWRSPASAVCLDKHAYIASAQH